MRKDDAVLLIAAMRPDMLVDDGVADRTAHLWALAATMLHMGVAEGVRA